MDLLCFTHSPRPNQEAFTNDMARLPGKKKFLATGLFDLVAIDPSSSTTNCPICLEPIATTRRSIITASCQHAFHEHCLKHWLEMHNTCPTCRRELYRLSRRELEGVERGRIESVESGPPFRGHALNALTRWVVEDEITNIQRRREEEDERRTEQRRRSRGSWWSWRRRS